MVDSHARNVHGFADPNGSSVLLQFDDFPALEAYLYTRYQECMFEMTPFDLRLYTGSANNNFSLDSGPFEMHIAMPSEHTNHTNQSASKEKSQNKNIQQSIMEKNNQNVLHVQNSVSESARPAQITDHLHDHSYFYSNYKVISHELSYSVCPGKKPKNT